MSDVKNCGCVGIGSFYWTHNKFYGKAAHHIASTLWLHGQSSTRTPRRAISEARRHCRAVRRRHGRMENGKDIARSLQCRPEETAQSRCPTPGHSKRNIGKDCNTYTTSTRACALPARALRSIINCCSSGTHCAFSTEIPLR